MALIPYKGDGSWIKKTLQDIHKCLNSDKIPKAHIDCDYCSYVKSQNETQNTPKDRSTQWQKEIELEN